MLLASACSFVNSFDDVRTEPVEQGGSSGTSTAGSSGANPPSEAGAAGEGGSSMGGGDGGGGGSGNTGNGGSNTAGTDPGPTDGGTGGTGPIVEEDAGMVLIGATVNGGWNLVAMSPEQGVELDREFTNRVLGLAYDNVRKTSDIWYVFLANDSGNPNDLATLSVREYNEHDGSYDELGSFEVPAPAEPDSIAVLNQRLFYHSVTQQSGMPKALGFTLLNTAEPDAVERLGSEQAADLANLIGLIGRANSSGPGGSVTLITRIPAPCSPLCTVSARRGSVTTGTQVAFDAAEGAGKEVGKVKSPAELFLPAFTAGSVGSSPRDIFIFPPAATADSEVVTLLPNNVTVDKTFAYPITTDRFVAAAFDPCRQILITIPQLENTLYAITTEDEGDTSIKQTLDHSGYRLAYDQYTRTVLATSEDTNNPKIDAWTLSGTSTAPKLDAREDDEENAWAPESDLLPKLIAVKTPPKLMCN